MMMRNPCKIYDSRIFERKPKRKNPSRISKIKFVKKWNHFVCKKNFWQVKKKTIVEWWKLIIIIYDKININEKRMENEKNYIGILSAVNFDFKTLKITNKLINKRIVFSWLNEV